MTSTMNILNLERFKGCVLFTISIRRWGNRAKIKDLKALEEYLNQRNREVAEDEGGQVKSAPVVSLADDRVKSTKVLLKSDKMDALNRKLTGIKSYVQARSMPSYFQKAMFVLREADVAETNDYLRKAVEEVRATELEAFLATYPEDIEAARTTKVKLGGLGPLFNAGDYPAVEDMRTRFDLDWNWLTLSVPENIPDELKAEANEKFKKRLLNAAEDIENALREEFRELLDHCVERLAPPEPGQKKKVIRESMMENFKAFLETFERKNVLGDAELMPLVAQARELIGQTDTQKLRDYESVRDLARNKFAEIRKSVDDMIETKASRGFRFDK